MLSSPLQIERLKGLLSDASVADTERMARSAAAGGKDADGIDYDSDLDDEEPVKRGGPAEAGQLAALQTLVAQLQRENLELSKQVGLPRHERVSGCAVAVSVACECRV